MRLVVKNLLQNDQFELDLEERNYHIGRGIENDIVLDNFFVSQRHAIMRYEKQLVGLKPVGSAPTLVNGVEAPNGITCTIQPGDEIEIGKFVLSVYDDGISDAQRKEVVIAQKQLNELERTVHEELLKRLDLRKVDLDTIPQAEYRQLVEQALDNVIDAKMPTVEPVVVEYVSLAMLREALSVRHMQTERNLHKSPVSQMGFRQFEDFEKKTYRRAISELEAKHGRAASLEDLENWLTHHARDLKFQLMAGVKSQLLRLYLRTNILDTVFGLGPLESLNNLPNVTEIMVVNPGLIYIERRVDENKTVVEKTGRQFVSNDVALTIIERIVAPLGLRVDRSTPLVDARLPDGSRVNIIIPPLAVSGPCITIRKFSKNPITMEKLVREKRALSPQTAEFLRACVASRKNVVISGGTGSGKTTLLNCLSEFIPPRERVVTIEDTAELKLDQEHVVTLEARPANVQGKGAYTIRDLVKNALRMRPDRIIVGECRGAEALDMLQAMNTGHDGSMTTGHSNSPADMLRRLEIMVLQAADMPIRAIREQVASAIDVVVQITRFGDGTRKITQVTEIGRVDPETGEIIVEDIFRYGYAPGALVGSLQHTGYIPTFFEELMRRADVSFDLLFSLEPEK